MSESTLKAFELLFHLSRVGNTTLAKLSRDIGWDKATALRYLTAMEKKGVVERRDGDWTLGLALLELANRVPVTENIASRTKPTLEELARVTGETVSLSSLVGSDLVYLAKAEGGRALRLRLSPGDRLPLYCTAAGKCIMSKFSATQRKQYLQEVKLTTIAPKTITNLNSLEEEIEKTIRRGWAMDDEELEAGLICYSMSLELVQYGFSGALSVSGPSVRMIQAQGKIVEELRKSILQLQELLGNGLSSDEPKLFDPGRGGFKSTDWHRPGSEVYE